MSSNLDYLNPDLLPLEDKVQAYLKAEKELQQARITRTMHEHPTPTPEFDQRPATGSYDQQTDEEQQRISAVEDDLATLRREILTMLPVRDEWVKVNLGYGPSRVGAFRNENFGTTPEEEEYLLRVVQ
ncbi:hypothetical protein [Hymenobacter guriensis]|uniref:TraR/DksA family transcriptional regulator n=1 Tax=Hymenobacter guriensis TaxID=2793065 RepID=A0ABS0L5K4_9BACT|nr:hypothetical protein [Hymenobacter guriensis]MBG8554803.1 hypothetical protein [Hymenobacter guriensis]